MELFVIYLWLKLDAFIAASAAVAIGCTLFFIFYLIVRSDKVGDGYGTTHPTNKEYDKEHGWQWSLAVILLVASSAFGLLTPSAKDTAILVGASYAIDLAKSPEGQKIQTLIRKKANDYLDEQLKEKEKK